jgi:hypothetical protein
MEVSHLSPSTLARSRLRGVCGSTVRPLKFAVSRHGGVRHRVWIVAAAALLLLGSCGYFPESSFQLAPSSRLPRWIALPAGLRRDEVTVTLDYYASPLGRVAAFSLYDSHRQRLRKVSGSQRGDHPLLLKNKRAGFAPGFPSYEVITIDGLPDVVEHRALEPTFYMTDDPVVLEELGVPGNHHLERP